MKRIRLGEYSSKFWPLKRRLFIGLYDQSSKHWLFFTSRSNKLDLITSQKFSSNIVKWSQDALISDPVFVSIWDYFLTHLHCHKTELNLWHYLQINLKKDPKLSHFSQIEDVAALRAYYTPKESK